MSFRWPFIRKAKLEIGNPTVSGFSGEERVLPKVATTEREPKLEMDAAALRSHPVLSLIPPRQLQRLLNESAFVEKRKGDVVFQVGDPCEAFFVVVSGRCESRDVTGAVERVFGPGDTIGGFAFLNREPHRFAVVVATHCLLLRIASDELLALFGKDPCFAGRFSLALTGRFEVVGEIPEPKRVRRIVSLLSLAGRIDDRAMVIRLSRELHAITGQKVLMVRLVAGSKAVTLDDWPKVASHLNGTFAFQKSVTEVGEGVHELRLSVGPERREAAFVPPLLSHCGGHFDFVILHVDAAIPVAPAIECLIQSDIACVLVQPEARGLEDFASLMQQLSEQARGTSEHVKPIVVVDENLPREEFREAIAKLDIPVHSFAHGFPMAGVPGDSRFERHVRRLAREIARCRVGLALSSGGAKGLAHIGVIQVLEENGIEVDCVAGASMGAYVGGLWARGADGAQLEEIARENESRWGLWSLFDPVLPPRRGFIKTGRVMKRLRRWLGDAWFCDLIRPLRVVATNLATLERVVFSTGDVGNAIEASIAIPGIIVPVTVNGETLIDGGIADPLPVDVLREMGIERIIAVNVIPPPERLRDWREQKRMAGAAKPAGCSLGTILNRHLNYFAKGNVLDTLLQAISGAQTRVAETSGLGADVLLRPLYCGARWYDFTNPGKYIALGRKVAEAQLPAIIALAKGGSYENIQLPVLAGVA